MQSKMKTLGDYRDFCALLADNDVNHPAVKLFDAKIAEQGRDEKVMADEFQMLNLIAAMFAPDYRDPSTVPDDKVQP